MGNIGNIIVRTQKFSGTTKAVITIICYKPMWQTMKEKDISQYELLQRGIDNRTLYNLRKNRNITMYTLEKICKALDCDPQEVVEFVNEENSEREENE